MELVDSALQRPAQFDGGSRGLSYSFESTSKSIDEVLDKTEKLTKHISGQGMSALEKWTKKVKELAEYTKDLAEHQAKYAGVAGFGGSTGGGGGNGGSGSTAGLPVPGGGNNNGGHGGTTATVIGVQRTNGGGRGGGPGGPDGPNLSGPSWSDRFRSYLSTPQGRAVAGTTAAVLGTAAVAGVAYNNAQDHVIAGDLLYNQIGSYSAGARGNGGLTPGSMVRQDRDRARDLFADNPRMNRGFSGEEEFVNSVQGLRNGGIGAYTGIGANGGIGGNLATATQTASNIATITGISGAQASQAAPGLYSATASHALRANGISNMSNGQLRSDTDIARDVARKIANTAQLRGQNIRNPRVQNGIINALMTEGTPASRGLAEVTGGVGTPLHQAVVEQIRGNFQTNFNYNPTRQGDRDSTGTGTSLVNSVQGAGAERTARQSAFSQAMTDDVARTQGFLEDVNRFNEESGLAAGLGNVTGVLGPLGDAIGRVTGLLNTFGIALLAWQGMGRGRGPGGGPTPAPVPGRNGPRGPRGGPRGGGLGGPAIAVASGVLAGGNIGTAAYNNSEGYRNFIDDNYVGHDDHFGLTEQVVGRAGALFTGNFRTAFSGLSSDAYRNALTNSGGGMIESVTTAGRNIGDPPLSGSTRMDPRLRQGIGALMQMNPRLRLNSGARSSGEQASLFSKGVTNVPPGHQESRHERGLAADIGPSTELGWLQENAPKVGLEFPHRGEPWHVEVAGTRNDFSRYRSEHGGGSEGNPPPLETSGGNPFNLPNYPVPASMQRSETGSVLAAYLRTAFGEGEARITSAYRPGSTTASGNVSNHRSARAIDIAGPTPTRAGWGDSSLRRIFQHFWRIKGHLRELILSGVPDNQKWITSGQENPPNKSGTAWRDHWNHVHVATHNRNLPFVGAMLPEGSADSSTVQQGSGGGGTRNAPSSMYGSVSEAEATASLLSGGRTREGGVVNNSTTGAGRRAAVGSDGGIEQFLSGLRQVESSNNYTARNPNSSATGAYQYLKRTWNNYAGYREAAAAPPEIQDRRAREDRMRAYQKYGNWRAAAVDHIYPAYADDPAEWDITLPGANAGHTGNTYASKVLDAAGMVGDPPLPEMPTGISSPSGGNVSVMAGDPILSVGGGMTMGSGVGHEGSRGGGGHGGKCIHISNLAIHAQLPNGEEIVRMIEAVDAHAERRHAVNELASM